MAVYIADQVPAETHIGDIDKIPLGRTSLQIRKLNLPDIDGVGRRPGRPAGRHPKGNGKFPGCEPDRRRSRWVKGPEATRARRMIQKAVDHFIEGAVSAMDGYGGKTEVNGFLSQFPGMTGVGGLPGFKGRQKIPQ